jgi:hypothetical protein
MNCRLNTFSEETIDSVCIAHAEKQRITKKSESVAHNDQHKHT